MSTKSKSDVHRATRKKTAGARANLFVRLWHRFVVARWIVIGLVVVLVGVRLALPSILESYVNHQLDHSKDYSGRVGDIHLQLWRGRYRIDDLKIFKRSGAVRVPLYAASRMYLSIQWDELLRGSLVGEIRVEDPHLNFVSGPTSEQSQTGADEGWSSILESLFPFDINRLEMTNGQVHFKNEFSTPPVDIYINDLAATATNLTNTREIHGELPSGVKAQATTVGGGNLGLELQLDPMAKLPTYQVEATLTNVDLTALNDFLRAYGKFDVAHGQFALFTSVASKDGNYEGYVKVFFNHLDVFAWEKERGKNALQIFWDGIVGAATSILKNQNRDSLATRVPISGTYNDSKVGVVPAIGTLLRHAFIRALVPSVEPKVTLEDAQKKVEQKKETQTNSPSSQKTSGKLLDRTNTP